MNTERKVYGWLQDNLDGTTTEILPEPIDAVHECYPVSCVKKREDGTHYIWTLAGVFPA